MAILHMQTEDVDEIGRTILRTSTDIQEKISALNYSIRSLSSAWQGDASESFVDDACSLVQRLQIQTEELDILSQRTVREVQQWLETDAIDSKFTDFFGNPSFSLGDGKLLFAGGYLATHLTWSASFPTSMVFTGPNWMRKIVGIKEMTRVIKPTTLVKQMAVLALVANVTEGVYTGAQTYFDPRYAGTNRALPAAVLDGFVKTAILVGGTGILIGTTFLISTITAPAWIVGGAVIGTWVLGGMAIDKFAQTPLWNLWQKSYLRDQGIEKGTRYLNDAQNIVKQKLSDGKDLLKKAFSGFIGDLLPAPA